MTVDMGPDEAREAAVNAYIYLYPLVTMEITRQQTTNIEIGTNPGSGPMNTFSHIREFPEPTSPSGMVRLGKVLPGG